MTLRSTVYDTITGGATVAALIGTRCYPDRLPQNVTLPAVVFSKVSDVDGIYRTHDIGQRPRTIVRIQLSVYAETGDGAAELGAALIALWSGYQALPDIGQAEVENVIATYEPALDRHRTIIDVMLDWKR